MDNPRFLVIERVLPNNLPSDDKIKCSLNCRGGPKIMDSVSGEIFCSSCGCVLEEKLPDRGRESYCNLDDHLVGSNTAPIPPDSIFGIDATIMGDKDGMGRRLSAKSQDTFYRLKLLNKRHTRYWKNGSLRSSLILLNALHMKLGLPDSIIEDVSYLYKKVLHEKITIGRSAKNLMCACVYFSCKNQGIPRSILDISTASNTNKKNVARAYRVLLETMNLSSIPFSPKEFVTKIAKEATISEKSQRFAIETLEIAESEELLEGKNPKALAAAALYLACMLSNERKSQSQLSKASGITANTIRMRYCELKMNIFEAQK